MTEEKRGHAERTLTNYLQIHWPGARRRIGDGRSGVQGVIGIPGMRVDLRGQKRWVPQELREWRQDLLDAMEAEDDHALLVVRRYGAEVGRWSAHMPLRQLGIPLYGEGAWVEMELKDAVTVLQYLQTNPRLPFLRLAA